MDVKTKYYEIATGVIINTDYIVTINANTNTVTMSTGECIKLESSKLKELVTMFV